MKDYDVVSTPALLGRDISDKALAHPYATREDASATYFTAFVLVAAIVLQRFGIPVGTSYLSVVGPLGLLLGATMVLRGSLALDRKRAMIFMALLAWIFVASSVQAAYPETLGTAPSWLSLVQFVSLSSFGVLAFSRPIAERHFFRVVNYILLGLAIAGIAQFVAQFAGLSVFSFKTFVPSNLLLEGPYNTVIPIGVSGLLKSNGFFLVEPSVFSQFMALAIIIEVLVFRRWLYAVAFAGGLICSISGTGWIMILSFVLTAGFSLGARGVLMSVATVALGVAAMAALAVAFPAGFDFFLSRSSEIYSIGSSGHQRFITPWWIGDYVFSRAPWTALYGLGAGVSDHLAMQPSWKYNVNPPVKIALEFGIPAFFIYLLFLIVGRRTSTQKALLVPVLVLLLFDGGYSQFPPVLFPALILIVVADLIPMALEPRERVALANNGPTRRGS